MKPLLPLNPTHQSSIIEHLPKTILCQVMQAQLLQAVLSTETDCIFFKDTQSVYFHCNRAFARWVGLCTPPQVRGKQDIQLPWLMTQTSIAAFCQSDLTVLTGHTQHREVILLQWHHSPREQWVSVTKAPLLDQYGICYGLLGIVRDVKNQ